MFVSQILYNLIMKLVFIATKETAKFDNSRSNRLQPDQSSLVTGRALLLLKFTKREATCREDLPDNQI